MCDDAFGPYVVALLEAGYDFPPNVSVLDLGTPSLDLTGYIEEFNALVIVDTVHSEGRAGELRRYTREEILRHPVQPRTSPHEPGLKEAMLTAEFHGRGPTEALLVGVIPETTATGIGLTPRVSDALARAVREVLVELERLGVEVRPRVFPRAPRIWWEESAVVG